MNESRYAKLGGPLLILVGTLWVRIPVVVGTLLLSDLPDAMSGLWAEMAGWHPLWAVTIAWQMIGKLALLVWSLFVLLQLHARSRSAPRQTITFLWSGIGIGLIGLLLVVTSNNYSEVAVDLTGTLRRLVAGFVNASFWSVYLRESKRAQATFVEN